MATLSLQTEACVLVRKQPTESHLPYVLFSPEHGSMTAWLRSGKRDGASSIALDLFDDIDVMLTSSNQGQTWFVKEARVLIRRVSIGRSYDSLKQASAFTAIVARNQVPQEGRIKAAALLRQALDAFADASHAPEIVYLKALYSFARDEGYPVKQEWVEQLQPALKEASQALLRLSLVEIPNDPPTQAAASKLIRRLEDYLRANTEILLD
jgi:recombinational DNA repair protein (RecF pathway)